MLRTLVVRTGAQAGRATPVDLAGMVAGVLAPVLLAGYVIAAAIWINDRPRRQGTGGGYSHVSDLISDLGDRSDAVGTLFVWANVVIALLLALFAYIVFRRLPVGQWALLALAAAVPLTVVVGTVRCQTACAVPDHTPRTVAWQQAIHVAGAVLTVVVIVALPFLAWRALPGRARYRSFKRVSRWLAIIAALATLALVLAGIFSSGGVELLGIAERAVWAAGYAWIVSAAWVMFRQRKGVPGRGFDVTRLQENVIYGRAGVDNGLVVIGAIEDAARFRAALRNALDDGTVRAELPRPLPTGAARRDFTVTVGLTRKGLGALGVDYAWTATTRDPFGDGMRGRPELLGDVGESAPPQWQPEWQSDDLHVLVWVMALGEPALAAAINAIAPLLDGLEVRVWQPTKARPGSREPFGFADAVSQPWLADVHPAERRRFGGGKLVRSGRRLAWEPIALGEFILGEIDEGDDITPVPEPYDLFDGGTFLVIRKLEQRVDAFHAWSARAARRHPQVADDLEELLVGRTRDGAPLASSRVPVGDPDNDFTFGTDPEGFQCPMSAHIRRANPRDGLGFDGTPAHRHRLIRRGMPYEDGDGSQGLVFAAINARILGQFEFVQGQWLNDGNPFRVGAAPDVIAGSWDGPRQVIVHRRIGPVVAPIGRPFVRTRGGEYFLLPAMSGLWKLAASG